MKRILIGVATVVVFVGAIYFTGAYTFFLERRVDETVIVPSVSKDSATDGDDVTVVQTFTGEFVDADAFHTGSGTATIVRYSDGTSVLRFENFSVVNGPDVYVYLSTSTEPTSDITSLGSYIDLGPLKGNVGNQNYLLPEQSDGYTTVALWCKRFGVLFPYAVLHEAGN